MEMYILIQFGSGLVGGGSFFEGEGKFLIYNQNGWNKIKQPFLKKYTSIMRRKQTSFVVKRFLDFLLIERKKEIQSQNEIDDEDTTSSQIQNKDDEAQSQNEIDVELDEKPLDEIIKEYFKKLETKNGINIRR